MKALLLVLVAGATAMAEETIGDGAYLDYDLSAFKAGQWVESEETMVSPSEDGTTATDRSFTRMACVRAEQEFVWMEETTWDAATPDKKSVTLCQVSRKDNRIVKAWIGKPGGDGEALKVITSLPVAEVHPKGTTLTGKVTVEKAEVAGKTVEIQKIEVTIVEPGEKGAKTIETTWLDKSGPFPVRWNDAALLKERTRGAKLDKAVEGPAGVVRMESDFGDGSFKIAMTATGTDAKPTLTTK